MKLLRALVPLLAIAINACSSNDTSDAADELAAATHAKLAPVMPPHLAIMYAMSWFGIPQKGDPLGPGTDASWGNWKIPGNCSPTGAPMTCVDGERDIASRYRPLAGIYSSTGRDAESLARIDLMLSTIRRPCANDLGARIDSFAVQLDGTKFTSLHDSSPSASAENAFQALVHFYSEADNANLVNAVLPGDDATWYWNNSSLDCAANHATCVAAVQQDVIDMLTLAVEHPASSLRIDGKPVLFFYLSSQMKAAEWSAVLNHARATSIKGTTHDFFAFASVQGGNGAAYFPAFDGIAPWIDLNDWSKTSGATVRDHAAAYAKMQHDALYAAVPADKVVLGGVAPGFDDFTNGWKQCVTRQMPPANEAKPRDPGVLDGAIDYLATKHAKGVILETWDDWTEGSFFEPSVSEGTSKIEQLQARLGDLYGESAVSTAPLAQRWASYGQPRGCAGAQPSPKIDLCAPVGPACGAPQILTPTASESVGPSIRLRVSAPSCIDAMIPYVDGVEAMPAVKTNAIDAWIPVTMGAHVLNVNGWSGSDVYVSSKIAFTRTY